tara:strand:+ start:211 stop:549 length:339 start_codon:yes stop_codon:yes gene_type:complete
MKERTNSFFLVCLLVKKKGEKRLLLRFCSKRHTESARAINTTTNSSRERKNVRPILLTGDNVPRFPDEALIQPVQKVVLGQSVDDFFFNRHEHIRVAREIGAKMYAHRETSE